MKASLAPQHRLDGRRQFGAKTGPLAPGQQPLCPLACAAVQLPERDGRGPASVHDDTWLGDPGEDEGSSAHDVVFPHDLAQLLLVFHSVLQ